MKTAEFETILVAIDFLEANPDVVATAIGLNKIHGGKLWLVYADDSAPYFHSPEREDASGTATLDTGSIDTNAALAKIRKQLSKAETAAKFVLLDGPAAENILEKAVEIGADLIVIGAHRHGRLYHILFGDTGDEIMRRAPCPVLVVPRKSGKNA